MADDLEVELIAGLTIRGVLDAIPQAVVVTDRAGQIVLWNRSAEHMYGWSEVEVIGRSVLDVLGPATDRDENQERLDARAVGTDFTGDWTVASRSGEILQVLVSTRPVFGAKGEVVGIVGAAEDVTGLRQAEQQTRDLTEHLRLAMEASGLGTWRWAIATDDVTLDERFEALLGLSRGEFDGTFEMFESLLHPDDRDEIVANIEHAVDSGAWYRVEHRVVWPDRSVHWLAAAGGVTVSDNGQVVAAFGCSVDVTDRVNQAAESARLATLATDAAERERHQRERLEFVGVINDALNQSSSVHEVMVNVTNRAVPRLGDWCSIHVLNDPSTDIPDVVVAHIDPGMVDYARQLQERFPYDPASPTGVALVIRTGQTVFYPDITDDVLADVDATDEERNIIAQLALRSVIAVPLVKRGRILGAMQFVLSGTDRRYLQDDVVLAHAVAGRIASSLENHRLNEQQRRIAQTLQRALLPPHVPDIPGIDIAVRYWAGGEGSEVGGDFYDVFALDTTQTWAVVIGDVCGTGPEAAAVTGMARHSIRESAWHGDDPGQVLTSLNRTIKRSTLNTFVTATYATVDLSHTLPVLTVACGGHPLPVHVTTTGAQTIGTPGTLLGVLDTGHYHPITLQLAPNDVIVFYTDGATDLPAPHHLNEAQFTNLIDSATTHNLTAETVADNIHHALEQILPLAQRHDDIAILVLRVTPPSQPPTHDPAALS